MALEIKIGTGSDCNFRVNDQNVSKVHANLVIESNDNIWIEDLDSTNGTRVNGIGIRKKKLTENDTILLGGSYNLEINTVRYNVRDYSREFFKLKENYEEREAELEKLGTPISLKFHLLRMLPIMLAGIIGIIISLILSKTGVLNNTGVNSQVLTIVSSFVTAMAPSIGFLMYSFNVNKHHDKLKKRTAELNKKYKNIIKCPGKRKDGKDCNAYIGDFDWEKRALQQRCPYCGSIWYFI